MAQGKAEEERLRKEAEAQFESEQFARAYPIYSQLVSLSPNDADLNFRFGTTALYAGVEKSKAIRHLNFAVKRGCQDERVYFYLGKAYHLNYEFEKATEAYKKYLAKTELKPEDQLPASRNLQMCQKGKELLANIRDVVVLEKTNAAITDFYRYYDLSEIGGRVLSTPEELLTKYDEKAKLVSVMHFPGDALTIFFTSYGKKGEFGKDIYRADILPGGEFSDPERLPAAINTPYDEDFAFMHPDGKTFYFASKGHNSMGGYDIFRSMYDPASDRFSDPVNLDFAINTPDDDIFYVVDSLKETAYFASSRSSAQDELHVYKVMVKRLPVNLTFIAGDYDAQIEGLGPVAELVVYDELTGREVVRTTAREGAEGYLLDLPKAGLYKIEVKAEGSSVIHQGTFEVPNLGTSVAFKQEIELVTENGLEQLIITNHFDQQLDVNLAELSADALRRKAGLEIADEEKIAELNSSEETLREEVSRDQITAVAGFAADQNLESVKSIMTQRASDESALAAKARTQAEQLLDLAQSKNEEARALATEAATLREQADPADKDRYIKVMREVQNKLNAADMAREQAENAVAVAEQLDRDAKELEERSAGHSTTLAALDVALEADERTEAVTLLTTFYEETQARKTVTLPSKETLTALSRENDAQQTAWLQEVSDLEADLERIQKRTEVVNTQLENARKKSEREALSEELAMLNAERVATVDALDKKREMSETAGEEGRDLTIQLAFIDKAEAIEPREGAIGFDAARGANLLASIQQTAGQLEALSINDEETLALLDDDYKATRNDITLLEGISAQAIANDFELKPVSGLRNGYTNELDRIRTASISPELQQRTLMLTELDKVENQIAFLRSVNTENLSEEEERALRSEIASASEWRDELAENINQEGGTMVATADEAESARQKYTPEVSWSREDRGPGADTEALASQLERQRKAADALESRRRENAEAIIASDDAAEIEALRAENDQIVAALNFIDQSHDADALEASWEQDLKVAIDDNSSFEARTQQQIAVTESYISALEDLEDFKRGSLSDDELADLNERIFKAKNRLDSYNSDLELSVSANEQPSENTESQTNEVLADATDESDAETGTSAASDVNAFVPEALPESNAALSRLLEKQGNADDQRDWVDAAILEREEAIDRVDDPAAQDQLLMEITRLRDVREGLLPEPVVDVTPEQPETATSDASASNATPAEEALAELSEQLRPIDSAELAELESDPLLAEVVERVEESEDFMKADAEVELKTAEIEQLEAEIQLAERPGKQRRIDNKIEQAYFDKSEAEVIRSLEYSKALNAQWNANRPLLEAALEDLDVSTPAGKTLKREVERKLSNAEDLRIDAARIRQTAEAEIDEIEQAYLYQRATAAELEAVAIQQRMLLALEQAEELEQFDAEVVADVVNGRYEPETETEAETETETEVEAVVDMTADADAVQPAAVTERQTDEDVPESAAETVLAEIREEKPELPASAMAAIEIEAEGNVAEPVKRWADEFDLTSEERNAVLNTVAYEAYNAQRENYLRADARVQTILESRNAAAEDLAGLNTRIAALEAAIAASENTAEQEGLKEELRALYRNAQVRYEEVKEADERLAEARQERDAEATALKDMAAMLDGAEIVAEARGALKPEARLSAPLAVDDYLFAYPAKLDQPLFAFTGGNARYSESRPIPLNPSLPEGVIFKVQVGAFRNKIPQDHFKEFAPLAGETLDNGITRYTAGLFLDFTSADAAKEAIREQGYRDAFVVAFRDGQRVSLSSAREETRDLEALAANTTAQSGRTSNTETASVTSSTSESNTAASTASAVKTNRTTAENIGGQGEIPSYATNWSEKRGGFFSVQIGVYSKPVKLDDIYNVEDVHVQVTSNGYYRYTSGAFKTFAEAEAWKTQVRSKGISDAFIVGFVDGKKTPVATLRESEALYAPQPSQQSKPDPEPEPEAEQVSYKVKIGSFAGEVPSQTALALLTLEEKYGIMQTVSGGKTTYWTRSFTSEAAALKAAEDFKAYGVEVEVVEE
jgi:hypothetical protein